jgi:hypothetical protein
VDSSSPFRIPSTLIKISETMRGAAMQRETPSQSWAMVLESWWSDTKPELRIGACDSFIPRFLA